MTNKITWSLEGGAEISERLRALGKKAQAKQGKATMAGAEVIREDAASRAKKLSGELSENMQAEELRSSPGRASVGVGPHKKQFYGLFLEFGTEPHDVKGQALQVAPGIFRRSASPGGTPPLPFLRPAFDTKQNEAIEAVAKELREALGL